LIQTKLQSTTFSYIGSFKNKMHHILEVLMFKFTIFVLITSFLLFGIYFLACIGLDYYMTTKENAFYDIVISNLSKLYITSVCFFTQNHIFQTKLPFYFWKNVILNAQLWFWWIQTLSKFDLITHHKCTKITCVFEWTSFISIQIQKLKSLNT